MPINYGTALKIIANGNRPYYTPKGNVHKAIPLFTDEGKLRGHVIMTIKPDIDDGKAHFNMYADLLGLASQNINVWTCMHIHELEGNYFYTKRRKYRAYSLYDKKGKCYGVSVYDHSLDGNDEKFVRFMHPNDINTDFL